MKSKGRVGFADQPGPAAQEVEGGTRSLSGRRFALLLIAVLLLGLSSGWVISETLLLSPRCDERQAVREIYGLEGEPSSSAIDNLAEVVQQHPECFSDEVREFYGPPATPAEQTICEALQRHAANPTSDEARRTVQTIREAGAPSAPEFIAIQEQIDRLGNQLMLAGADLGALEAQCADDFGVNLDL